MEIVRQIPFMQFTHQVASGRFAGKTFYVKTDFTDGVRIMREQKKVWTNQCTAVNRYAMIGIQYLHRWLLDVTDTAQQVDHMNGDTLDNCRDNLRIVTHQENCLNRSKYRNNKSGHPGVFKLKTGGYRAYASKGRRRIARDCRTIEEAIATRDELAATLFGQFNRV